MQRMEWSGTEIEADAAWRFAEIKRRPDTSKVQAQYNVEDEYWSILGMMRFAVWADTTLYLLPPEAPSDYGEDFRLYDWKLDVKATVHPNGKLVYRWGTKYSSDVYVLAVVDKEEPTKTRLAGWAWYVELINGRTVDWNNLGKPAKVLDQRQLHPMAELHRDLCYEAELRSFAA
jgi:hypothetical protein